MALTAKETDELGYDGKQLVMKYFYDHGYQVSPVDAAGDYIDFSITKDGETMNVFVRTDTRIWKTGNIVVERFMHRRDSKTLVRGWLFDGKADVLAYLDAVEGALYLLDWNRLKTFVEKHCKLTVFKNQTDHNTEGNVYLVPVNRVIKDKCFLEKGVVDASGLWKYKFEKPIPF